MCIPDMQIEALENPGQLCKSRGTDVIGKKGIEKSWEEQLHGKTGVEEVEVTASGRPVRTLRRTDPVPGADIMLSIDLDLQRIAEEAFGDQRGALVALDPDRSEEHTSELQSLMRIPYAVFCLKKKKSD